MLCPSNISGDFVVTGDQEVARFPITRTKYIEGTVCSDVDVTLRVAQGLRPDGTWCVFQDRVVTASVGEGTGVPFTARVVDTDVAIMIVGAVGAANVFLSINHRSESS